MKLVYKGKFESEEQLPKGVLPDNAVKFREPESANKLNLLMFVFMIPTVVLIGMFMLLSGFIHGDVIVPYGYKISFTGLLLSLLTFFPHELLHAVCFGKDSVVQLYIAPKKLMLFVISNDPVSKVRFILLSLLPNLIFGWIPLIIWVVFPNTGPLFYFSVICILMGCGDYINVFNGVRQMPKGSMHQHSGFNSYWFMP